jgi:phosphopantothenoylcysteine decarboxylase/phosphopantothenate--cysteine ligase
MADVENILKAISTSDNSWEGKKVLITAGPTYEAIDPVRFIGNHSSGKMGYALAEKALSKGAEVVLISGPTQLQAPKGVNLIRVKTAAEMLTAVRANKAQLYICAAAVADYTVAKPSDQKIKKKKASLSIDLSPTVDILAEIGATKKEGDFVVGFALETNNEEENAQAKMKRKNCDMMVLNSLQNEGAGFGGDTNRITIFHKDNNRNDFELKTKSAVAQDIIDTIQLKWLG